MSGKGGIQMENTFPTGRPAGPNEVVERENFIPESVERLMTGHDIMLAGPRRIGKSSVAGEILRRVTARSAYTASVDVFGAVSLESLATRLMASILANRTGILAKATRNVSDLRKYFSQASISAKLHDLELGVALLGRTPSPEELLALALDTAESIALKDQKRMVIVIDEFQDIQKMGGPAVLKQMRSHIQHQQHAVYLFMGSQAHLMNDLFQGPNQAFFRFAIRMELPPIPWVEWERYIGDRLALEGLSIRQTALEILGEKTGGHPHGVMVVAEAAVLHARLAGQTVVEADDAIFGYRSSLEGTLGAIYAQEWAMVRERKHGASVLLAIAEEREPYHGASNRSSISDAIKWLQDRGLIISERRGAHRLLEPMFGQWLRDRV